VRIKNDIAVEVVLVLAPSARLEAIIPGSARCAIGDKAHSRIVGEAQIIYLAILPTGAIPIHAIAGEGGDIASGIVLVGGAVPVAAPQATRL
jgi:hypothetical protein